MRYLFSLVVFGLLTMSLAAFAAPAADTPAPSKVTSVLTVQKVTTNDKGEEVLVSADKADPGDLLVYTLTVTNGDTTAIQNLKPILPIPAGMEYQPNTGTPHYFEASTDGKTFAAAPLQQDVTQPDGTVKTVDVPFAQYRALRWTVAELDPGMSVTMSARVMIAKPSAGG